MEKLIDQIRKMGIVPVVKIGDASKAAGVARALCDGGIPCAEVTFRTEAAAESIKEMIKTCPGMLVGAGTVLTCDQVDQAVDAGAAFVVSPGLNPDVVKYCVDKEIPIFPGCANPSDMEQAMKHGIKVVKFFPAEVLGGLKAIKAMSAPYSQMLFMPTGGIDPSNVCSYLEDDRVIACGGTWMVPPNAVAAGDFEEIRRLTEEAVHTMLGFRLAHVGINCENEENARKAAEDFEKIFGFKANENPNSIFSGSYIETLKSPYLGTNGHIAVAVNSVERAKAYLERKGVGFKEESAVYRADGKMQAVYLDKEIGKFAVHLVRGSKN